MTGRAGVIIDDVDTFLVVQKLAAMTRAELREDCSITDGKAELFFVDRWWAAVQNSVWRCRPQIVSDSASMEAVADIGLSLIFNLVVDDEWQDTFLKFGEDGMFLKPRGRASRQ